MSTAKPYEWKPISEWSDQWLDDPLPIAIRAMQEQLDEESWKAFHDRAAREWSVESGQIEGAFDIEQGITIQLIAHGFAASLLNEQRNGLSKEQVHQMLLDLKNTLDGVFSFVKSDRKLSVNYICEMHQALMRSVDSYDGYFLDPQTKELRVAKQPLAKGKFKDLPNNPSRDDGSVHQFCPPLQVSGQMEELVRIHEVLEGRNVPALVRAAWLHHAFTQIHPFQDGNGRVARALASLVLLKAGSLPFTVYRDMRSRYVRCLRMADDGQPQELINVFESCVYRLAVSLWSQASLRHPRAINASDNLDDLLAALQESLIAQESQTPITWGRSAELMLQLKNSAVSKLRDAASKTSKAMGIAGVSLRADYGSAIYPSGKLGVATIEAWGQEAVSASTVQIDTLVITFRSGIETKLLIGFDRFHPTRNGFFGVVAAIETGDSIEVLVPSFFAHFESVGLEILFESWLKKAINLGLVKWHERNQ